MNSITDIISTKADELFENKDEIINLETDDETEKQKNKETKKQDDEKKEDSAENNNEQISNNFKSASQLKSMIHAMRDQLDAMLRIVNGEEVELRNKLEPGKEALETGEAVIEGVFNGEKMIGPDGKEYGVPPNYASKSKLVEGDIMKLTITNNGRFIYKQISPIERKRLVGELISNGDQWNALADGKTYKVLTASVTFYKGKPGDEVVFFIAKDSDCAWGAVENIIRK